MVFMQRPVQFILKELLLLQPTSELCFIHNTFSEVHSRSAILKEPFSVAEMVMGIISSDAGL